MMVDIVRQIALTGCRRSEIIGLRWSDVDLSNSCLRLSDSREGASIRPIGLPVVEFLETQRKVSAGDHVFPGSRGGKAYGAFPKQWKKIFAGTTLETITAHVLRHSFASIANDLGLSEITIAALLGHANGSVTSRYVHTLDNTLVMAADTVSGYIEGLLDGKEFKKSAHAFDRCARRASLEQFLQGATE
jgi:integrase